MLVVSSPIAQGCARRRPSHLDCRSIAVFELTHRGDIAVLRMIHGKANALDIDLCKGLSAQLEALKASPARAIVLTGQGRIFSAGVDLLRALSEGSAYFRQFLPPLR